MRSRSGAYVVSRAARAVFVEILEHRRLLAAAGELDPTFGAGGTLIVQDWELVPTDSAIQVDNKILVSGFGLFDVGHVIRLNANGTVDRAFGNNGLASSGFGPFTSIANAVAVGPGGRIAVAGTAGPFGRQDTTPRQSTIVMYDSAGKLDTSFAGDGILNATAFPRGFREVQFQPDGKILAIGEKLVRYNANGTIDTNFGGGDGIVDISGKEILVQTGGRIVALGDFAVFRFTSAGAFDTSFDNDGVISGVKGTDIALAPDEDILLAGNGPDAKLVSRFNVADGSVDRSFGENGHATVFGGQELAVTANNIIVGGSLPGIAGPQFQLEFTALNFIGKLDTTFASGTGRWRTLIGDSTRLVGLAVQQGKVLAVGDAGVPTETPGRSTSKPALARYDVEATGTPPLRQTPFSGTPVALPGVIQAEDFDRGGEGAAFHDTDFANVGGAYRPDEGVDIQTRTAGGPYVGFVRAEEWLEYTVNVTQAGTYDITVAAAHLQNGGRFHLELDGQRITPNLTVPRTNNWTSFANVAHKLVTLPVGLHVLRLAFDAAGSLGYVGNFDSINIARAQENQTPFKGTPFKPGDRIQAEDFDNGGQGVSFFDTTPANDGGAYRDTPVDIQPTTDAGGGFNVGWLKPGEWLEYTIDVPEDAGYQFRFRLASQGTSGGFSLMVDGEVLSNLGTADTGGWQSWRDLELARLHQLTAGRHVLRLQMFGVGPTGFTVNVNWFEFHRQVLPIP